MVRFGFRRSHPSSDNDAQGVHLQEPAPLESDRSFGVLNRIFCGRHRKFLKDEDRGFRRTTGSFSHFENQKVDTPAKNTEQFRRSQSASISGKESDLWHDWRKKPDSLKKTRSGNNTTLSDDLGDDAIVVTAIHKLGVLRGRSLTRRSFADENKEPLAAADMMISPVGSFMSATSRKENKTKTPYEFTTSLSPPHEYIESEDLEEIDFTQTEEAPPPATRLLFFPLDQHLDNAASMVSMGSGFDDDTETDVPLVADVIVHHDLVSENDRESTTDMSARHDQYVVADTTEENHQQVDTQSRVNTETSYHANASREGCTASTTNDECTLETESTRSSTKMTLDMYDEEDELPQLGGLCSPLSLDQGVQIIAGLVLQRNNVECGEFDKP